MGSGASKDSSDDEDEKVLVISKSLLISLIQLENKYLLPTYLFINFQILWKSMNYVSMVTYFSISFDSKS